LWGRCLVAADEVRCFSDSTRAHLLRAYPALAHGNVTVIPHRVEFTVARQPRADRLAPLVVGIVGEISYQKGAAIVEELVRLSEQDPEGPRVVVIGTLDLATRSRQLTVTGRYRRDDLAALVEEHGVNMLFFPSIWPETFSYVVAEMMALGLPIVAFDVGAPAERLAGYALSRLCRDITARSAYETLATFHRQLALREASAA
jgi:glycosyltransferase involved in cell wall biosynthesis